MSHVELRTYEVAEGGMDAFIEWFHGLVPIRERYGYRILFAFADREANRFTWAVEHEQPLDVAQKAYDPAPERAQHFKTNPGVVTGSTAVEVDVVIPTRGTGARP
ncbi:hypothetical protein [Sciscionella marina]|uniref:hypothetical protein n=1 Tax=Sciscionella marina TaxID=508770 RepID=UPI00037C91E2|nr:hypothetical protein [Sciscionella marina]